MINWREKFVATGLHFVVTLLLAAVAAALIFLVWFPDPFQTMVGGTELFLLVTGCDLALGPLMSLVVYNSRKTRRALIIDYTLVGVLQIAALVYGVLIVADTRPVYVAFNTDRFEVVAAADIRDNELAAALKPEYAVRPWTGPRFIAVHVPLADHNDALFESLNGNEEHQRPKFYVPFESKLDVIRKRAKTVAVLEQKKPEAKALIEQAVRNTGRPAEQLAWLPVRFSKGFWTALIDPADGKPLQYFPLDPY